VEWGRGFNGYDEAYIIIMSRYGEKQGGILPLKFPVFEVAIFGI
jgi:hypothetical protein